jgi:hypothetical protein
MKKTKVELEPIVELRPMCEDDGVRLIMCTRTPAGYYTLMENYIRIQLKNKPSWWYRLWMRICFNAKWVDKK